MPLISFVARRILGSFLPIVNIEGGWRGADVVVWGFRGSYTIVGNFRHFEMRGMVLQGE